MKVLLSAFACDPRHGSEPGNGWNWAVALAAEGCEVVALVPEHSRTPIEEGLDAYRARRLRFEYVPVPWLPSVRRASPARYLLWQVAAYRRARRLLAREPFDVVHHVTYGSLQGGSLLGRLGPPFVFGPVGGGQTAERDLAHWFGPAWRFERLRTWVTRRARWLPWVRSAVRRAAVVLAVNDDTAELARRLGARQVVPVLDTALTPDFFPDDVVGSRAARDSPAPDQPFRILWLGRMLPRKGCNLALRAFARVDLPAAELVVVGGGPCSPEVEQLAAAPELAGRVRLDGYVRYDELAARFREADLFLFTSLRDSGGSQLLEAAAFGLPLVVLDHHGAGDRLPDAAARKIPISRPDDLVAAVARALEELAADPDLRGRMGEAAREFALAHTWPLAARDMIDRYRSLLAPTPDAPGDHPERT